MRTVNSNLYDENYYLKLCEGFENIGTCSLRQLKICSFIKESNKKILDIGCGRGEISKRLLEQGNFVVSVDYSNVAIGICCSVLSNIQNSTVMKHDISYGFDFLKSDYFDYVILADIVEHLYDEQISILSNNLARITKDDSIIIIDTPILTKNRLESENCWHVNIKGHVQEIINLFPQYKFINAEWIINPYHCCILLQKTEN